MSVLLKPFFVLAPMDDVTDSSFRRVVDECASADLYFTEFVNVDGLNSPGRPNLLPKLYFAPSEKPPVVQLWGNKPEHYYEIAKQIADGSLVSEMDDHFAINAHLSSKTTQIDTMQESSDAHSWGLKTAHAMRSFAGIDINMGCPVKTVCNNGCCSALINNRSLATEIIQATKEGAGGKLPVSVKTRLGWNEIDYSWHELLLNQGIAMLTVHGRTRKEMSKVPANWQAIGHIRSLRDTLAPSTLMVGNGDVKNRQHGEKLACEYKLDGIMIGRGVFEDPFVFSQNSPWPNYSLEDKKQLYLRHVSLFFETWTRSERKIVTLNKFCKTYINGFDGASELRARLMQAQYSEEIRRLLMQPALVEA